MRLLCLSGGAAVLLNTKAESDIRMTRVDGLAAALTNEAVATVIVADVGQIDNRLAAVVHDAGRRGISVGLIPFDGSRPAALMRLIDGDAGVRSTKARIGLYSSRGLDHDFAQSAAAPDGAAVVRLQRKTQRDGGTDYASPDDACFRVQTESFTALGVVTEGRQTYCLLGMGCIHPTISDPPVGRLSPKDIAADHWLLQSCHSPYAWSDLGAYLTVPLAVALAGQARTVICSTHVQTYIPDLLAVYVDLLNAGRSAGEIVLALNAHASRMGVDRDPFILLGRPDARAIVPSGQPVPKAATRRSVAGRNLGRLHRLITNLEFIRRDNPFGLDLQRNRAFALFQRDSSWMARLDLRVVHERGGPSLGLPALVDSHRPPNERVSLRETTQRLGPAWHAEGGFYTVGENLDRSYVAKTAEPSRATCRVCGEPLLDRHMRYVGQSGSAAYARRRQRVCPRCLVVEHVQPVHADATRIDVQRRKQGLDLDLVYFNRTREPQWVYSYAFVSDPNNISRHTGRAVYDALLSQVPTSPRAFGPMSVAPGGEFRTCFNVGPVPDRFWYLLVEVNLFVDFCWNWFSFTYRSAGIDEWLESDDYRKSLPRAWPRPRSAPG
jgi:hypothetical protein